MALRVELDKLKEQLECVREQILICKEEIQKRDGQADLTNFVRLLAVLRSNEQHITDTLHALGFGPQRPD